MKDELAAASTLLDCPGLGPIVARDYGKCLAGAIARLRVYRIELMLQWAAVKLDFKWEVFYDYGNNDGWPDPPIIVHAGPANYELMLDCTLRGISPNGFSSRNFELQPIERVVAVALWNEIPKLYWPKRLRLPALTLDDASEAVCSDCASLRKWVATKGAQFFP